MIYKIGSSASDVQFLFTEDMKHRDLLLVVQYCQKSCFLPFWLAFLTHLTRSLLDITN
uniref:Uncharacterized protein n=1 Tax=Arundo donax TaxID=35708 RepID=A0A0A9ACH1_ARUDO